MIQFSAKKSFLILLSIHLYPCCGFGSWVQILSHDPLEMGKVPGVVCFPPHFISVIYQIAVPLWKLPLWHPTLYVWEP